MKRNVTARGTMQKRSKTANVPVTIKAMTLYRAPKRTGFPPITRRTHRYSVQTTVTCAGSGYIQTVFFANGMYQPQAGVTSHYPHYFNQMATLYNHYRIVSSKCTTYLLNRPDTNNCIVSMFLDDDSTPSINTQYDAFEREGSVIRTNVNGGTTPIQVTKYFNAKKAFGSKATNDSFIGTVASNPSETSTFIIHVQGTPSAAYALLTVVEYDAVWTELKSVAAST